MGELSLPSLPLVVFFPLSVVPLLSLVLFFAHAPQSERVEHAMFSFTTINA